MTNSAAPVDQRQRDAIVGNLNETIFVEAGAGTGKTTAMVDRIVNLVRSGVPVENIAAITFTRKAASELVDRVREKLERSVVDEEPGDAGHIDRALGSLDGASIQTIDAFAYRILSEHALEAGLPPGIEIIDEVAATLDFEAALRDCLEELLDVDHSYCVPLEFLLAAGMTVEHLRQLARDLNRQRHRLLRRPKAEWDLRAFNDAPLYDIFDEVVGLLDDCLDRSDLLAKAIQSYATWKDDLASATGIHDRLAVWNREYKTPRGGKKDAWGRDTKAVKDDLKDLERRRLRYLREEASRMLAPVVHHLETFVLDQAQARATAGRLTFNDLLILVRDLLRDSQAVRERVHRRFTHLLIDEFQDTNPLQIEIASLIARDPATPADLPWQQAPLKPGSLFVVGDPKQSIYRFRNADVALYREASESLDATPLSLVQNFRSVAPVLEWANHTFAGLFGQGHDNAQATYEAIHSWHDGLSDTDGVFYFGEEQEKASAEEVREMEAEDVARVVEDLLRRQPPVRDGDTTRPLRRSDIAILFPRRSVVGSLEDAFEARDIPFRVESQELLFNTQEVRDLTSILEALVDPSNEPAVIAALRSPAFACSDVELYEHRLAGGRWNFMARDFPAGPVGDALRWLRDYRDEALTRPVNIVLEGLLRERKVFEAAVAHRRPRSRWQRYRFLLEQARSFATQPGATLQRFVDWLEENREQQTRVQEVAAPETDDAAVRFMTIHAAKGLEFPVVILAGLGSRTSNTLPVALCKESGDFTFRCGPKDSSVQYVDFADAADRHQELEGFEEVRLLYVAATRARHTLVVSLHCNKWSKKPIEQLVGACDESLWHLYPFSDAPGERAAPPPATPARQLALEKPITARLDDWRQRRQLLVAELGMGNAVAATTIARVGTPDAETATEDAAVLEVGDENEPWKRGRAGTSLGRAVHATLQVADLVTGAGIDSAAVSQAAAEAIPARANEVARIARETIATSTVREAVQGNAYWREVFVSAPLEDHLLEGFIDLLFERPDGYVVVDYKTDAVRNDAEVDAAVERYRLQIAAYAVALEANLNRPVVECRFVFANEYNVWERTLTDLSEAVTQVRQRLADWKPISPGAPA